MGGDLADSYNPPFNTISFLWTDLNPNSAGNIYHGSVDSDTFVIVFEDIPSYASSSCRTSLEVVLKRNFDIRLVYIRNDIGVASYCRARDVSIGLKGAAGDVFEYEQVFGPSSSGMPDNATIWFSRAAAPTSSPSVSYSPTEPPSAAPSGVPSISMSPTGQPSSVPSLAPIVRPTGTPSSVPSAVPTSQPSLSFSPSLQPSVRTDAYRSSEQAYSGSYFGSSGYAGLTSLSMYDDNTVALELPFMFKFFRNEHNYAYLSSNGLVSFASSASPASSSRPQDPSSKTKQQPESGGSGGGGNGDIHTSRRAPAVAGVAAKNVAVDSSDTDVVHVVVLHRHLASSRSPLALASSIRAQHEDGDAPMFRASVLSVQSHLHMLSVRGATKEALSYLSGHSDVKFVQRSVEVKAVGRVGSATHDMNATVYAWGLDRIDQSDLPLDYAAYLPAGAGVNDGSGVSVYVLDTGIDTTHIEFAGSNVTNIFDGYNNGGIISADNDVNG
jgi:hypothetical protein